jgi:hypothetical protein
MYEYIKYSTLPTHIVYIRCWRIIYMKKSASNAKDSARAFILIPGLELIKYTNIVYL